MKIIIKYHLENKHILLSVSTGKFNYVIQKDGSSGLAFISKSILIMWGIESLVTEFKSKMNNKGQLESQ